MKSFKDKVAVVTGGGSGIGRALALALAEQGCHLALADISSENLKESQQLAERLGVNCSVHCVDVGNAEAMSAFAEEVVDSHGQVNLLFNNAGITLQKTFANHSLEDWQRILGVNVWGVIHGCKYFLPHLLKTGEAHIVNLSSMAGFMGLPNQSSYCATKSAVQGLSESLWAELAGQGVGVTSVHPGAIRTNIIQSTLAESDNPKVAQKNLEMVARMGMPPEKAAQIILRAVKKRQLRVRVGKDAVLLDWLKRMMPSLIHWPIGKIVAKREQAA